jgi:hypothetical protein
VNKNDFYNASGCADPTAYHAMQNIQRDQRAEARREVDRLVNDIKTLTAERGFTVLNRIELKDKKSGIIFK